jgi:septum formation protein
MGERSVTHHPRPPSLILASASPRRLALLRQIGLEPTKILAPNIDETPQKAEFPRLYATRMATEKLATVQDESAYIVAADTVVAAGTRILPKAETVEQAKFCLTLLSGRRHHVYTALAIRSPTGKTATRLVTSVVGFARLDDPTITAYLATNEWQGKAGAYAIQGFAATFITFLSGSHSAVVGLPLHETTNLLRGLGYPVMPAHAGIHDFSATPPPSC